MRLHARAPQKRSVRLPVYPGKGGLIAGLDGLSNKARLDAVDSDAPRNVLGAHRAAIIRILARPAAGWKKPSQVPPQGGP